MSNSRTKDDEEHVKILNTAPDFPTYIKLRRLWTEKYRPCTIDGYVFKDTSQKQQVESWIKEQSIPHLLFSGGAGIGKTTLAKILIKSLDIDEFDVLEINASRQTGVDHIRDVIIGFVSTMPFGKFKIVLLDEADYLSTNAQATLRGVMETYAETARFIFTCNYPNKIIPALHSRCQGFHFEKIDHTEFTARVADILIKENIEFDLDTLDDFIRTTYPDLRKCLNTCQMHSSSGRLIAVTSDSNTADYKLEMVELFKKGKIREARQLICSQARPEEMEDLFRFCYDNLDLWSKTEEGQDQAIIIIRQGLVNHTLCADAEVNLSATLAELAMLSK